MPACSVAWMVTSRRARPSWSRIAPYRKSPACRRSPSRPSSARRSSSQRLVHHWLYHRSVKFDGFHDLVVWQGADAELQAETVGLEPFMLHQDLVDDFLWRAHEIGPLRARAGIELGAGRGWPAAFPADAAHRLAMGGEGNVARILAVGGDEAMCAYTHGQGPGLASDLFGRITIALDQRRKLAG